MQTRWTEAPSNLTGGPPMELPIMHLDYKTTQANHTFEFGHDEAMERDVDF